jgi:predicted nucleic acid-binding protein
MKETFVLDACAMIAFLSDEKGAEKIEAVLIGAVKGECSLYINMINVLEIYYGIYREEGLEKAEWVMDIIDSLPITIVKSLRDRLVRESGRLKANYKISLADSIALAEASLRKARLITSDHHEFDAIDEKENIQFYWFR